MFLLALARLQDDAREAAHSKEKAIQGKGGNSSSKGLKTKW